MEQGQFQVYCGDGKGKTTASLGLAVRALGANKKVYIGQFIKDMEYHEINVLRKIPGITIELYGSGDGCLIDRDAENKDILAAQNGLKKAKNAILSQEYDLVILDEINIAYGLHLINEEEMLELIKIRPNNVELVFTGRACPEKVLEKADLVTEMKEIKHYYNTKGLLARDGIER